MARTSGLLLPGSRLSTSFSIRADGCGGRKGGMKGGRVPVYGIPTGNEGLPCRFQGGVEADGQGYGRRAIIATGHLCGGRRTVHTSRTSYDAAF